MTTTREVSNDLIQAAIALGKAQMMREDAERRAGKGYPNASRDEATALAAYNKKLAAFLSLVLHFAETQP